MTIKLYILIKLGRRVNEIQKKVILGMIALFTISVIYLPQVIHYPHGSTVHKGYAFLWNRSYGIDLVALIVEWIGIVIVGGSLFLYFKSKKDDL